jgi:hypothetical protein
MVERIRVSSLMVATVPLGKRPVSVGAGLGKGKLERSPLEFRRIAHFGLIDLRAQAKVPARRPLAVAHGGSSTLTLSPT